MPIHCRFREPLLFAIIFLLLTLTCTVGLCEEKEVDTSRTAPKKLYKPKAEDSFTFVILGDRTTGKPWGLEVLERAVDEINLLRPDFVFNVGDMVNGYNTRGRWIGQWREYVSIMRRLKVPWFPVAGNHDIYWRGRRRPADEHEGDYEFHFGPVWYSFMHKKSCFIALFTDEGHTETGYRTYRDPNAQKMSAVQTKWLSQTLSKARRARHVFIFQHHPRWVGGSYGTDWDRIHKMLKKAGNVSAVFAGHGHFLQYQGNRDGIDQYMLGVTGGETGQIVAKRFYHHYFLVTVREKTYHAVTIRVGSILDPKNLEKTTPVVKPTIASQSKVSASFCARYDTVAAVNDQAEPYDSFDLSIHRFTWFDNAHKGTKEWIAYTFKEPAKVDSIEIYWYDDSRDGMGCRVPQSWRLLYWKDDKWIPVSKPSGYDKVQDRYVRVTFKPVLTKGLRIEAQLQKDYSAGILEWKVGEEKAQQPEEEATERRDGLEPLVIRAKLEFLSDVPEFHELHMAITEEDLKALVAKNNLLVKVNENGEQKSYHVYRQDGENVIVMFREGKLSGIQRMRCDKAGVPEKK